MRIEWSQIMDGQPVEEGRLVYGVGTVQVDEDDEKEAEEAGGNPLVDLADASSVDSGPYWVIGQMFPRDPALKGEWQRQKLRYQLLKWYFDKHYESPYKAQFCENFSTETGADLQQAQLAWDYIREQGLLENVRGAYGATISHQGIREVERRLTNDSSSNLLGVHMSQTNDFRGGTFGSVQLGGSGNSASVNQYNGVSGDELANLSTLLNREVALLPEEEQTSAKSLTEGIIEQSKKEKPDQTVIKALISALPATIKELPALGDFVLKMFG
jgi:hypothetical protein